MRPAKLSDPEIEEHLQRLPGWARAGESLGKTYQFKNFSQSLQFVNHIAETAESVNHHPDIDIRYDKVTLTLSTHDVGGITNNDIELAAAADDISDAFTE